LLTLAGHVVLATDPSEIVVANNPVIDPLAVGPTSTVLGFLEIISSLSGLPLHAMQTTTVNFPTERLETSSAVVCIIPLQGKTELAPFAFAMRGLGRPTIADVVERAAPNNPLSSS
jgi:hypothetical protein